ncbi:MAG TPA: hypothetical protein VME46_23695 [Acidimicrobiales bacterium]|nr:hypothetical protein [Acidimicrobiales bacterium]
MVDEETELRQVRRQIDSLNMTRLTGPFDPPTQELYERLCRQERYLLLHLRVA